MLTRLFTKLISDELTEFSYDAACAGLHYRVYNSAVREIWGDNGEVYGEIWGDMGRCTTRRWASTCRAS